MITINATRLLAIPASLVLAGVAGCATSGPTVRTDTAPGVNMTGYRSYGFFQQAGTDQGAYQTILTERLKAAVDRNMKGRGYAYSEQGPELLANFYVNVQEKQKITTTPSSSVGVAYGRGYHGYRYGRYSTWQTQEVRTYEYTEGTLTIDLVDAQQKQLVWSGVIEGRLTKKALEQPEQTINAAVDAIFANFP